MTLDLNITDFPTRGRRKLPLDFEVVRELGEQDVAAMHTVSVGSEPPSLKRISDRHHSLARLLAAGTPEEEAAMIVGYDRSRVSILKNSPAFAELLALYQKEVSHQFTTVVEHMAGVSRDALLELRDRLEEQPEKFTNNELRVLITEMADRAPEDGDGTERLPEIIELITPDLPGGATEGEE